jgi:hypothetical protein
MVLMAPASQTSALDIIDSAVITIRRAILERFPPGAERERWLAWLEAAFWSVAVTSSRRLDRARGRRRHLQWAREKFERDAAAFADLSRVQFTIGRDRGVWSYSAVPSEAGCVDKPGVRIPMETFCRGMTTSAGAWRRSRIDEPRIMGELSQLLEFRPAAG